MIVETFRLEATDNDLLAAPSRLAAIPYNGRLILEFQAANNTLTAFWAVTVQLPNGDLPLNEVRIPEGVTDGALNLDDKYTITVPAALGGHILVDCVETGSSVLVVRATLMP